MDVPKDLKFTESDEWVRVEGDTATTGITDYAQDQLSDIVYVEYVVDEGDTVDQGEAHSAVESVKAAADVYMPIGGTIVAINEDLEASPELVNTDPYGKAWMVKFEITNASELDDLMDADAYKKFCEEREH
ncbi:MAG: glycine cleavage system protein GcvH [Anaerolineales bacterium]|jgi:glycine cleavage system H protein